MHYQLAINKVSRADSVKQRPERCSSHNWPTPVKVSVA